MGSGRIEFSRDECVGEEFRSNVEHKVEKKPKSQDERRASRKVGFERGFNDFKRGATFANGSFMVDELSGSM